jgi:hypothetical protein
MALSFTRPPGLATARAVLIVGLIFPADVAAQQAVVPLQLSLSDPGARSMGFGGAFVALADDATAAFSNPAGLVQLVRPEISIETRRWEYSTPYTEGGNISGLPNGAGVDSTLGLRTATAEHGTSGVSFLSVAWPHENWSIALFRHVYANLEFYGETQGLFSGEEACCRIRYGDQQMASKLDIVNYGLAAAYRISERFDVGFGIVYNDVSIIANTLEYLWDGDTPESFYEPNSFLPSRLILEERMAVDGDDWTVTAGFLWRMSEHWRMGGVFRQGSDNRLGTRVIAGQAIDLGVPPGEVAFEISGVSASFPNIYGLGLVYRNPDGNLTVSLQWDRIEYSEIPRSIPLDDQTIDDGNELHLGAEYVFLESTPLIALRLGAWHEPDHQMYATTDDPFTRAMLPKGEDDMHYTAGLGLAMDRFQIDLAFDLSGRVDSFSLSVIYAF